MKAAKEPRDIAEQAMARGSFLVGRGPGMQHGGG